jgi:drug/metabolite transporter (DMT)-like permease
MLLWCVINKDPIFSWRVIQPAVISGLLLLLGGNGILIWAEQYVPSSLAAILLSSGPIWFVVLDKGKWRENFKNKATIAGLIVGTIGVLLLFGERLVSEVGAIGGKGGARMEMVALAGLVIASISWAAGSLYSKYKSVGNSNAVNSGWQMMAAGIGFLLFSGFTGEWRHFDWQAVPAISWVSITYLIIMGSLVGYSAYTWLLQVRPATQVSTHAYVNPVVAVLLGVIFIGERLSIVQLSGLIIILFSVLLINLVKYRGAARPRGNKWGSKGVLVPTDTQ